MVILTHVDFGSAQSTGPYFWNDLIRVNLFNPRSYSVDFESRHGVISQRILLLKDFNPYQSV